MTPMGRYDRISSLFLMGVSLVIIGGSLAYPVGTWSKPGPAFLPLWCGVIMGVFSASVFLQSQWRGRRREGKGKEREAVSFFTDRWPKLLGTVAILICYYFFLEILGYILCTFGLMLFLLRVVETTRWKIVFLEASLATAASFALFELWMKVQLPKGILWNLFR